jgi:hypothetical protein
LRNDINGLSTQLGSLATEVARLDDRMASSTATAIALGGMTFLPDMNFNLAVSAGFYDGAQAVAANIGVRVSPSVAITAGVGGGLNRRGKAGGRVGIVFGF